MAVRLLLTMALAGLLVALAWWTPAAGFLLSEEVLRDQVAWGGTLVSRAVDVSIARAGGHAVALRALYRAQVMTGWLMAAAPLMAALLVHRIPGLRARNPLEDLRRRGRAWVVLPMGMLSAVALLIMPTVLPTWAEPGWIALVALGCLWMW